MDRKALVVDDDRGVHALVKPILKDLGFNTMIAMNGEQGLDAALENVPDLIILDVIMPGLKGRQVCEKLKGYDKTKDVPVLFLTAKSSDDDIAAEMEAGAIGHLSKPIEVEDLIEAVKKIFPDLQ